MTEMRLSILYITICWVCLSGCQTTPGTERTDTELEAPTISAEKKTDDKATHYVFSWQFVDPNTDMTPRGGTSKGTAVKLLEEPSEAWKALQETGLSKLERDRRAILAMAGGYRTSFDFLEVAGFVSDFAPSKPYQSWGTEYVYVVEDSPEFISLQHVLVMFFEDEEGQVQGPAVVKHWRQDWHYQDQEINVYVGNDTWARERLEVNAVVGKWSQAVYQVDDSPRYQAVGTWVHDENYSAWESDQTWRPLPRREFSVRSDYDVLIGTNRHTILPTGWLHEEDNLKTVIDETSGSLAEGARYLAREYGVNRYDRIVGHDFEAGHEYWERSGPFWADVREIWTELLAGNARISKQKIEGMPMLMNVLMYSSELEAYDEKAGRQFMDDQLTKHYQWQ
ncbi:MAG: DUF6607 family protein [Pseudomonadota bacterium]